MTHADIVNFLIKLGFVVYLSLLFQFTLKPNQSSDQVRFALFNTLKFKQKS